MIPTRTKADILRNSAALNLVGGALFPDFPEKRFRDEKGRTFSVVLPSERPSREVIESTPWNEPHWAGYIELFEIFSPKDPELKFEVWIPAPQKKLWTEEIAKRQAATNSEEEETEGNKIV